MPRQLAFRLVSIALPLILVAALAEIVLQSRAGDEFGDSAVVHQESADAQLVYEFRPNTKTVVDGVEYAVNASGFRDDPFVAPKPGSPRVVVIGDSVAAGWGVAMENAFPQILERTIDGAAVYNVSVDGYGTRQELRLLETRGLALAPELIVWSYTLNDADESGRGLERHYSSRFELWSLLERGTRSVVESLRGLPSEYHRRIHARNANKTAAYLRALAALGKARGIPILVAITPVFDGPLDERYAWRAEHDRIAKLCLENGMRCLDLRPALAAVTNEPVAHDIWHPNARGHEAIANAIAAQIRAMTKSPARK